MRRGASKCRGVFLEIRCLLLALLIRGLRCCIGQRDGYVIAVRMLRYFPTWLHPEFKDARVRILRHFLVRRGQRWITAGSRRWLLKLDQDNVCRSRANILRDVSLARHVLRAASGKCGARLLGLAVRPSPSDRARLKYDSH